MAEIDKSRIRAYLRLHLADGVGPILFWRLVEAFGDVSAVPTSTSQLRRVDGIGDKTASAIAAVTDDQIDDELGEADRRGAKVICCEDEVYPPAMKSLPGRPPLLYVRGRLEPTDAVALGIVGARRSTHYGQEQSERFAQLLGRAGFTIVSGGARGIDTAAHRGALAVGARTVAVMGCGLSQTYPRENEQLFEQIVAEDRGALISELQMRTAVLAGNFPTRNRIISGLSLGVLVVEAARRSGSLITAREAAEQGREVFALPGRVDSPMSHGVNSLIRDGAILVQNLEDILEHLGNVGELLGPEESDGASALPPGLTPAEQSLADALADGPLAMDELARRCEIDSGPAAAAMTMLILKGAVVQKPGNVFARK